MATNCIDCTAPFCSAYLSILCRIAMVENETIILFGGTPECDGSCSTTDALYEVDDYEE